MRCPDCYHKALIQVRETGVVRGWMVAEAHKVMSVVNKHAAMMDLDQMSIGAAAFRLDAPGIHLNVSGGRRGGGKGWNDVRFSLL